MTLRSVKIVQWFLLLLFAVMPVWKVYFFTLIYEGFWWIYVKIESVVIEIYKVFLDYI